MRRQKKKDQLIDKMVVFWQPKHRTDSGQIFMFVLVQKRFSDSVLDNFRNKIECSTNYTGKKLINCRKIDQSRVPGCNHLLIIQLTLHLLCLVKYISISWWTAVQGLTMHSSRKIGLEVLSACVGDTNCLQQNRIFLVIETYEMGPFNEDAPHSSKKFHS